MGGLSGGGREKMSKICLNWVETPDFNKVYIVVFFNSLSTLLLISLVGFPSFVLFGFLSLNPGDLYLFN
jgi:hypothetical protein